MEKIELAIQNLKCGGCAATIKSNLEKIEGVSGIEVTPEENLVSLTEWNEESLEAVKSELRRLGYPLVNEDNPFFSKVKSYASCAVGKMTSTEN